MGELDRYVIAEYLNNTTDDNTSINPEDVLLFTLYDFPKTYVIDQRELGCICMASIITIGTFNMFIDNKHRYKKIKVLQIDKENIRNYNVFEANVNITILDEDKRIDSKKLLEFSKPVIERYIKDSPNVYFEYNPDKSTVTDVGSIRYMINYETLQEKSKTFTSYRIEEKKEIGEGETKIYSYCINIIDDELYIRSEDFGDEIKYSVDSLNMNNINDLFVDTIELDCAHII